MKKRNEHQNHILFSQYMSKTFKDLESFVLILGVGGV